MPKGVKRPISDLIEEQEKIIAKKSDELKQANAKLKELREIEKSELLEKVIQIAKEKNISVEELLSKVE